MHEVWAERLVFTTACTHTHTHTHTHHVGGLVELEVSSLEVWADLTATGHNTVCITVSLLMNPHNTHSHTNTHRYTLIPSLYKNTL